MLKELPPHTVATEIPHYEHVSLLYSSPPYKGNTNKYSKLDLLWARDVDTLVFPHVFDALESFSDAEHSKEEYANYRRARHTSLSQGQSRAVVPLSYISEDDSSQTFGSYADVAALDGNLDQQQQKTDSVLDIIQQPSLQWDITSPIPGQRKRQRTGTTPTVFDSDGDSSPQNNARNNINGASPSQGNIDKVAKYQRSASIGSNLSFEGKGVGRGIAIGASRAVSSVVKGVETQGSITISSDDVVGRKKEKNKR